MIINVINATSINTGGAMTVLKNYYLNEKEDKDDIKTIFFVSDNLSLELSKLPIKKNVDIISNSENKFYKNKNYWNLIGCSMACKNIEINVFYSFQNIIPYNIKAIYKKLYLHQSLPFFDNEWSLFKKEERKFWFYKNVYFLLIKKSIKECNQLVVQTQWLKKRVKHIFPNTNILVENPNIKTLIDKISLIKCDNINNSNDFLSLFYPASHVPYKNHIFLIDLMNDLVKTKNIKEIKLYLTIKEEKNIKSKIEKYGLEKNIIFMSELSYEDTLKKYLKSDIVLFPSSIESYGLPLVEAKLLNKKLIANDIEIFKEVVGDEYQNVKFINLNVNDWGSAILDFKDRMKN